MLNNRIKEMSWQDFQHRLEKTSTVIIPTGSIEVYGPHLPLGTDCIVAEEIALRVAEKYDAIISPTIELNDASSLIAFPGTLNISRSNFSNYLEDLLKVLVDYGFNNILFISGHGGSIDMTTALCKKYQRSHNVRFAQIDWWRFAISNSEGIFDENGIAAHGHASECSTSVMLYLRPELVDMAKAECVLTENVTHNIFSDVIQYVPFEEKTHNGIIGNALVAEAKKGEILVRRCVERIVNYMEYAFD